MDRRDYTDRVLSSLRRVTEKEREAIRSELDGHIEDHMEALRELGYDEELAEEREQLSSKKAQWENEKNAIGRVQQLREKIEDLNRQIEAAEQSYDLEKAAITMKTKDAQRIAYFCDRDPKVLREASPINLIPKKNVPASMLVCGTCDVTVECEQSEMFASALKKKGGVCDLLTYKYYDHNVSSKTSDKMEEIFFKSVDFLTNHIK